MPETLTVSAEQRLEALTAELAKVRAMYVALLERSVHDRRQLVQRLADAGLEDPDPKEGIRMALLAAWPWAVDGTDLGCRSAPIDNYQHQEQQ